MVDPPHQPFEQPQLAFALDVQEVASAEAWVEELKDVVPVFKVGLELFTRAGPAAVRAMVDQGAQCFLDLKLHDIPNTMAGAVASAAELGARYLTVHASAGPGALEAAAKAAEGTSLQLLAVTVLTSLDTEALGRIGWSGSPGDVALRLATLAQQAGVDGIVCSAQECAALRKRLGAQAILTVPGIRPASEDARSDDQRRVATPASAVRAGADLLVVGRPIRLASDPRATAAAIRREMGSA